MIVNAILVASPIPDSARLTYLPATISTPLDPGSALAILLAVSTLPRIIVIIIVVIFLFLGLGLRSGSSCRCCCRRIRRRRCRCRRVSRRRSGQKRLRFRAPGSDQLIIDLIPECPHFRAIEDADNQAVGSRLRL